MEDMYTKIDWQLVTQTTLLDIMMDECYDAGDYNDLEREYRRLLRGYNLFDASFVEDSKQSELRNDGDSAKIIYEENGKFGIRETRWHMGLPAIYDKTGRFYHDDTKDDTGYFLLYKDGKMGMIEIYDDINVIFDTIYDDINLIGSGIDYLLAKKLIMATQKTLQNNIVQPSLIMTPKPSLFKTTNMV